MSADLDPRFDPAFQRGYDPAAEPVRVPQTDVPGRRINPWMPVLWLLAIGLTAAGAWAQYQSRLMMARPNVDNVADYYVTPAVLEAFAPWLFCIGLAAIVATVFLHAVRWRPRDD